MAFTSWADELARFKDAIADRNTDAYFISSTENSREMRTMYTKLGNITTYLAWLEMKASNETNTINGSTAPIFLAVGGSS